MNGKAWSLTPLQTLLEAIAAEQATYAKYAKLRGRDKVDADFLSQAKQDWMKDSNLTTKAFKAWHDSLMYAVSS